MSDRFKYDSVQDRETLVAYLEHLTQAFAKGDMEIVQDDRVLRLRPGGLIDFTLEAKAGGEERKLALKFRWRESPVPEATKAPLVLRSSGAQADGTEPEGQGGQGSGA